MSNLLVLFTVVALTVSTHAQGTIKLENNNTIKTDGSGTYKIPFWVDLNGDGTRQHVAGSTTDEIGIGQWAALNGFGAAYLGLFLPGSNTAFAVAVFRSDSNSDFLAPPTSQTVVVPGFAAGSFPTLTLKAWIPGYTSPFAGTPGTVLGGTWTFTTTRPLGGIPPGGGPEISPSGLAGLGNETAGSGFGVGGDIALPTIPEPSAIALTALGLGAIFLLRRK